jgi:hypothetical protein
LYIALDAIKELDTMVLEVMPVMATGTVVTAVLEVAGAVEVLLGTTVILPLIKPTTLM